MGSTSTPPCSLTGTKSPKGLKLDGCNLKPLLLKDPTDPTLVKCTRGKTRDTMVWHFPNSAALESSIRIKDFKLVRNYDHLNNPNNEPLELYRLYNSERKGSQRADIEEQHNLVQSMPEKAKAMNAKLTKFLNEMQASYPITTRMHTEHLRQKQKFAGCFPTNSTVILWNSNFRRKGRR